MAFNLPSNLFTNPKVGASFSRPTDWPIITDTAEEVQFLFADTNTASLALRTSGAFPYTGTITIDWGDGTTNTVSQSVGTITNHFYTKGTGTPCSRGYTTFKIRVYTTTSPVTSSNRVNGCYIIPPTTIVGKYQELGVLEAYFGDSTITSVNNLFYSSFSGEALYNILEYVKLPATMPSGTNYTNAFSTASGGQSALKTIVMPTSSPGSPTFTGAFTNCTSLTQLIFPADANISGSLASVFLNCYSLKSVIFPTSMTLVTSLANAFQNCYSLQSVVLPPLNVCTSFNLAFRDCYSLVSVTLKGLHTGFASIDFTTAFQNCIRLEFVNFPSSVSSNPLYSFGQTFQNCVNLRSFKLSPGTVMSTISQMFFGCTALETVDIVGNGTQSGSFTNMSNAFSSCSNLTDVKLPTATTATTGVISALTPFLNCSSLETIVIPQGLGIGISALTLGASTLYSIKSIILPTAMNNCTNLTIGGSVANSTTLENLVLPTSMTACTNFVIQNTAVKKITLPTLSTALTTLGINQNPLLETISNMPTTTNQTSFASAFTGNFSLRSITLPTNVSPNVTTYASCFQNCYSLESIVFPTTQCTTNVAGNFNSIFLNCSALTSVTNFDKIQTNNAAAPAINADLNTTLLLPGLTFSVKLTKINFAGVVTTHQNQLTSLRLLNTTATVQWSGTTPQVNVSYTNINYTNLVQLFNDIAASGTYTAKTINITGCAGASSLTAADRLILTSKGWTITG